jgi:Cys-tRNA(Pro)/Cys-tRNA(Cys) deacylase
MGSLFFCEEGINVAEKKTNAMRLLDLQGISFNVLTYDTEDGKIDGVSVAAKIERDPGLVYKTLVTRGNSGELYVFVLPVEEELELKKAARAAGEKKVELIAVKNIRKVTGYIRGGCSPIGMKKAYPTFIDNSALNHEQIIISGGKIGLQLVISVKELCQITGAKIEDIS